MRRPRPTGGCYAKRKKEECFLNTHFNFTCIHRSQRTQYHSSTIKRSLNIDKIILSLEYFPHLSAELGPSSRNAYVWYEIIVTIGHKGKGKAIPLQAWTDPEVSRRLRLPDLKTKSAHEGGKVVSPTHRPPIPPRNIPGTHFC
jgi:hypothetical protein